MKSKFQWILTVLVLLSFVLSACGQAPVAEAPVAEEEAEAPAEEVEVEEPETEEVIEEPAMATEADLDAAFGAFLGSMEAYQTISLEALNEMMVETPPFLLDVRTIAETEEKGHIPGSVTIPLNELGESYAYLPAFDQTIVSYCGSGWRCTIALTGLGALG
ncbi:MAG: rhodanese-like domain-containing protein, partial [Anaerolineales bacterium]|nr:rhodanese-like domain-containing protein [Anaerolineales bacterium]